MRRGALLVGAGVAGLLALVLWQPVPIPGTGAQAAGPQYWTADRLDVRPQITTHVMPEYPAQLPAGVKGRVVLDLYIASDGRLERTRVVRAEPAGRFEDSALKAFAGARFTPGMRKGKPVRSVVRIEVNFGN